MLEGCIMERRETMSKIKFALIGCGSIATKHAEALMRTKETELVGVCDRDPVKARNFAAKYDVPWTMETQELLEKKGVEAVCICVPSGLHARMAIDAARAGKHVLIEKPLALSLEDADDIIQTCLQSGVKLGVVLQNRFKPAIIKLKKAVEAGDFGNLNHANATVRWNRNQNYYKENPWRANPKMGGGVLINQAIHNIDLMQWIMGPVDSVFAYTTNRPLGLQVEEVAVIVLTFQSGALGVIEATSAVYPVSLEESLSVFGETGTAIISGKKADHIKVWNVGGLKESVSFTQSGELDNNSGHAKCILDLVNSIQTGQKPMIDGYEGRKSLEIVLAIQRSANEKKEIKLSS